MARSWCKVSSSLDSHPKVRKAGNLGRQVFEFALRRNAELDLDGFIPGSYMEPDYMADALMLVDCHEMSRRDQSMSGLSRAVQAGLLVQHGNGYSISGWDHEWSKKPKSEAERKRQQRAKPRNDSLVIDQSRESHDAIVTERDCPDSHVREEKRREEKKEDPVKARASAIAELAVSEIKRLCGRKYDAATQTTQDHAKRLAKDKRTDEDVLLVIRSKIAWSRDPEWQDRFCPDTLLRPKNFPKYLDEARAKSSSKLNGQSRLRLPTSDEPPTGYYDPEAT